MLSRFGGKEIEAGAEIFGIPKERK